ncbi:CU044_5270 family protein [Streptomyces roseoverticillatus]|uniref:CU044_5270 family protein n=1 Tax=Streptomyces roseoverticillatus TaxID=66429 RepID=UPI001F232508|nr:CU044_5270 family protein [Streptomyces roseoverticillatus]MCF3105962.1 CU044_5270 family protein [Streptomyces roseoverticillatus]
MTGHDRNTDGADFLDFPGARGLKSAGKVAPPSAAAVAAALAAVRSAAGRAEGDGRAAGHAPAMELEWEPVAAAVVPVRTWRRRLPVFVSVAAVVAIALGVGFQPWSDSSDSGDAGAQVSPASERTGTAAGTETGTAPYWKVRTFRWGRSVEKDQRDESYETLWLSRNGVRGQFGDGPVREHSQGEVAGTAFWTGRNPIMWDELKKLPTDPAALRDRLVGKANEEESVPEALFDGIEKLLTRSPAEPQLRAALFKVLTGIPGVRVTEGVQDSTGRVGTAVDLDVDTWLRRLIIDTKAVHVLEGVDTARNDGLKWGTQKLKAGDLIHRTTYLSVGPAWEAPALSPRT